MSPTPVSSHSLSAALAEGLGPHLPTDVLVRATGSRIEVEVDGEHWAGSAAPDILDDPDQQAFDDESRLIERVVRATLIGVADAISRGRAEQWPPVPGRPSVSADPDAEVRGETLHVWFGDPAMPRVLLTPIPLTALRAGNDGPPPAR